MVKAIDCNNNVDGDDPECIVVCLLLSSVCMKANPPQAPVEVMGPSPTRQSRIRDRGREAWRERGR